LSFSHHIRRSAILLATLGAAITLISCSPPESHGEAQPATQPDAQVKTQPEQRANAESTRAKIESPITPRSSEPAPPLPVPPELTNTAGDLFTFSKHTDSVLLINVWATWCAPCRIEMPDLEELQNEFNESDFKVIGIAADEATAVTAFLQTIKVTYPNYVGDPDLIFAWSEKLGNKIVGVPFTVIIDQSGAIRWKKMGGRISVSEVGPMIKQLLTEN